MQSLEIQQIQSIKIQFYFLDSISSTAAVSVSPISKLSFHFQTQPLKVILVVDAFSTFNQKLKQGRLSCGFCNACIINEEG